MAWAFRCNEQRATSNEGEWIGDVVVAENSRKPRTSLIITLDLGTDDIWPQILAVAR